jgi:hypothetical protein
MGHGIRFMSCDAKVVDGDCNYGFRASFSRAALEPDSDSVKGLLALTNAYTEDVMLQCPSYVFFSRRSGRCRADPPVCLGELAARARTFWEA